MARGRATVSTVLQRPSERTGWSRRMPARRGGTAGILLALGSLVVGPLAAGASTPTTKNASAAIQRAYGVLFNLSDTSVGTKLAVIEGGSSLQQAMSQALSSSLAASAGGAKVRNVKLLKASACTQAGLVAPCAKVVYDIKAVKGPALLSGAVGYAVYSGGRWLVAKTTVCNLFSLLYLTENQSGSPPGC
jgi:hypothetical protein